MIAMTRSEIESMIMPVTESGCWIWLGRLNERGYGTIRWNGATARIHRVIYEFSNGRIPENMTLDHLCRVRCCVNPDHLEAVSIRTNVLRGIGLSALCAKQISCIHGHIYTSESTYIPHGTTQRVCRICRRRRLREYRQRKLTQT